MVMVSQQGDLQRATLHPNLQEYSSEVMWKHRFTFAGSFYFHTLGNMAFFFCCFAFLIGQGSFKQRTSTW